MKTLFISAFLALTMLASTAEAQYQSGNEIYSDLTGRTDAEQMFALGYVIGVVDAYIQKEVCVPQSVTQGQLAEVVKQFLASRPQIRHQPADILVVIAVKQHWPCQNGRKKS